MKKEMMPLTIPNGTVCYSIFYCNLPTLIRLKYMYTIILVNSIDKIAMIKSGKLTISSAIVPFLGG